ncbi:GH3 family domain-containing protein [Chitinimonas koreensis]|uniref:GH3 family domain-containing protein n=1 Tax=Chitinimonas koreensis TaxID=356302 RepID=UPI000424112A|nr:GH3 auxin-responsive promoter family protein [Chitinimonas koreensis]QNM94771.1 GH3 auxin-responsive promoter family protein [Chitinimonas koreensis]
MSLLLPPALWLLRAASQPAWRRMQQALRQPAAVQAATLDRILAASARSEHGRGLGLQRGDPRRVFSGLAPVDYAALRPLIEADLAGGGHRFSAERPLFYERSSGSGGAAKHLPYNRALRGAFDRMFRIWACDLLMHGLAPRSGRCFMSVSPPLLGRGQAADGTPIGSRDDTAYLGGPLAALLRPFLVLPQDALALRDGDDFKDVLAAALLAEPALEVVSVWNPGFWLILLDHALARLDALGPELRAGRMRRGGRDFRFAPIPAARLATVARAQQDGWRAVWPRLQLISCWQDAESARPAAALRAGFPGVAVQGKGLLATEGPVTVPLAGAPAPVPLLGEVYLELEMADGSLLPLERWRDGDRGEIVLTTPGGLLRYRLRDRVAVAGFHHAAPCLQFLGRAGGVVDLVGEKLAEDFVRGVLAGLHPAAAVLTLCPLAEAAPPHYALLTDLAADGLAERVDAALAASPHYRVARALGQLGAVRTAAQAAMAATLHAALAAGGMQEGNIKARALLDVEQARRVWAALPQPARPR